MRYLSLLPLAALLAACSTPSTPIAVVEPAVEPPVGRPGQLEFGLVSGTYHCEQGRSVGVQREAGNADRIRIAWVGADYALERNLSYSGLPRYEDASSGLVWIDLPWKGVLLDGRTNKPLVSECRMS